MEDFLGTPGPWEASVSILGGGITVEGPNGLLVAVCGLVTSPNKDEILCNAEMCSASIDMYDALKGLLEICKPFVTEHHYYHKKAIAALNKAKPKP